jgi:hypothetical protein
LSKASFGKNLNSSQYFENSMGEPSFFSFLINVKKTIDPAQLIKSKSRVMSKINPPIKAK